MGKIQMQKDRDVVKKEKLKTIKIKKIKDKYKRERINSYKRKNDQRLFNI